MSGWLYKPMPWSVLGSDWLEMWSKERPKTSLERAIFQRRQSSSEVGQHQLRGSLQFQALALLNVRGRCVGVMQSISTVLGDKHNDLSDVEFQGVYTSSQHSEYFDSIDPIIDALLLGADGDV
jgi:hypothetical protein